MKKAILFAVLAASMTAAAMPFGARRMFYHRRARFKPVPVKHAHPPRVHHHYHPNRPNMFWTGLGIGFLGGLAVDTLRPAQVVPPPPVVIRNPVWVPPVYESRPVLDTYGRVIRYEQVLVREGYWR